MKVYTMSGAWKCIDNYDSYMFGKKKCGGHSQKIHDVFAGYEPVLWEQWTVCEVSFRKSEEVIQRAKAVAETFQAPLTKDKFLPLESRWSENYVTKGLKVLYDWFFLKFLNGDKSGNVSELYNTVAFRYG